MSAVSSVAWSNEQGRCKSNPRQAEKGKDDDDDDDGGGDAKEANKQIECTTLDPAIAVS